MRFSSVSTLLRGALLLLVLAAGAFPQSQKPVIIPANPVDGIDYEPLPAIYMVAPQGTVKEAAIEIINRTAEPLQIIKVENPSERFAERIEVLEEGQRYRLTVRVKGEGKNGRYREVLLLETNWDSDPVLRIPMNVIIREHVYTFPPGVFMGRYDISQVRGDPDAARGMAQILMVYRKGTTGFEIKMSSDIPYLKIESEQGPKGDRWENTIWFDPERVEVGEVNGKIIIETNDPKVPRLEVPVTGGLLDN